MKNGGWVGVCGERQDRDQAVELDEVVQDLLEGEQGWNVGEHFQQGLVVHTQVRSVQGLVNDGVVADLEGEATQDKGGGGRIFQ